MKIYSPKTAQKFLANRISFSVEEFWAIALNADKQVLRADCLFRGSVDVCLFHPRDVFRFGCLNNASSLVVAHSHPSGSPKPSLQDIEVTERLFLAAEIFQLPIVDHIIVAKDCYYSFLEAGNGPNRNNDDATAPA